MHMRKFHWYFSQSGGRLANLFRVGVYVLGCGRIIFIIKDDGQGARRDMEQAKNLHTRKSGWSEAEANLLWEAAQDASMSGLALKAVFEKIANETGRKPNSIRNYYYAQAQKRLGSGQTAARFVPFAPGEVVWLVEEVLREKAEGRSVRSCLQRLSGGDHSLMLRYQNKYRSTIKARPELVSQAIEKLRAEGIDAEPPQVRSRVRQSLGDVVLSLGNRAQQQGDPELVKALSTIGDYLLGTKSPPAEGKSSLSVKLDLYRLALDEQRRAQSLLSESAGELLSPIKAFLGMPAPERAASLDSFLETLSARIGGLEAHIQREHPSFRSDI